MTEMELLVEVQDLAELLGILLHHCPDSRRCHGQRGFPDLVVAGKQGLLFRELKTDYADTSGEQDLWRWTITSGVARAARQPRQPGHQETTRELACWDIWRPRDLVSHRIRRELEQLT